jgi:hypothetical protein
MDGDHQDILMLETFHRRVDSALHTHNNPKPPAKFSPKLLECYDDFRSQIWQMSPAKVGLLMGRTPLDAYRKDKPCTRVQLSNTKLFEKGPVAL